MKDGIYVPMYLLSYLTAPSVNTPIAVQFVDKYSGQLALLEVIYLELFVYYLL